MLNKEAYGSQAPLIIRRGLVLIIFTRPRKMNVQIGKNKRGDSFEKKCVTRSLCSDLVHNKLF